MSSTETVFSIQIQINLVEVVIEVVSACKKLCQNHPFIISEKGSLNGKIIATQTKKILIKNNFSSLERQANGRLVFFEVFDKTFNATIEWKRNKTTTIELSSGQIWWENRSV